MPVPTRWKTCGRQNGKQSPRPFLALFSDVYWDCKTAGSVSPPLVPSQPHYPTPLTPLPAHWAGSLALRSMGVGVAHLTVLVVEEHLKGKW